MKKIVKYIGNQKWLTGKLYSIENVCNGKVELRVIGHNCIDFNGVKIMNIIVNENEIAEPNKQIIIDKIKYLLNEPISEFDLIKERHILNLLNELEEIINGEQN